MYHKNWWNNRWCWKFRFSHANVWSNIVQIILKQREVYGFILKMKHLILTKNIANTDNFKSFKYKVKLWENTVAQPAPNGILRNETIAVASKYLSNF